SPEQARGQTVGPPSDIYSLGMVFYELIAGRYPFSSDTPVGYLHAITLQRPAPLAGIPQTLAALISRMLDKEAGRRPGADQVRQELDAIEKSSSLPILPANPDDRRTPSKWVAKWAAAVALAVILAVAISLFIRPGSSTSTASAIRSIAVLPLDNYSG